MLLKPDGGELYVNVPTSHGLEIVDTWRTEISESMILGSAPTDGTMTSDASLVYVTDAAANERNRPLKWLRGNSCLKSQPAGTLAPALSTQAATCSSSPTKNPPTSP